MKAIRGLEPTLLNRDRDILIQEALAAAREESKPWDKPIALAEIAHLLPEPEKSNVATEAVNALEMIDASKDSAEFWKIYLEVASLLPKSPWREALSNLRSLLHTKYASHIHGAKYSLHLFRKLVNGLPEEAIQDAFLTADAFRAGYDRSSALAALAGRLAELGRTERALEIVQLVSREPSRSRAQVYADIIPHLAGAERTRVAEEAVGSARSVKEEEFRLLALSDLAPHLSDQELEDAFSRSLNLRVDHVAIQHLTLRRLSAQMTRLPRDQLYLLWRGALRKYAQQPRPALLDHLCSLLPSIIALGGENAARGTYRVIQRVAAVWP